MRGGVSLAVWMGGACRELVRLRQGSLGIPDEFVDGAAGAKVYKALLKECGYSEPVEIDVIAGTSAGGLNGVLLGWHLARGAGFGDDVRDMWLRLGDLGDLARRPLWNGHESLLRGDDYFFPQVRKALEQLDSDGVPCAQANHPLRLLVTATRLRPRTDAVFPGASACARAMRTRDWDKSVLGDPERWPAHVRAAVALCLASPAPMLVLAGPSFAVFHNDAFRSLLGKQARDDVFGEPLEQAWPQTARRLGPALQSVVRDGVAVASGSVPL